MPETKADDGVSTWVAMRHPDAPADLAAPTTRAAFDEVYAPKGWKITASANDQDYLDLAAGAPDRKA